jgi:hypothetical protein
LLLGGGYREQLSPEQHSVVLIAVATIVIDEAMEEVFGKMLHLTSRRTAQHNTPLKEQQRVTCALVNLMTEHLAAGQE